MMPKEVKVGGMVWKVTEKPTVDKQLNTMGISNWIYNEIEIKEDMCEQRKEETFVHELLHAIFYEAGIEEQDEDMINRVSKVLYQVLRENELKF